MSHTPEPWHVDKQGDVRSVNGNAVGLYGVTNKPRICIAVNACAGIETEFLERFDGRTLITAAEDANNRADAAEVRLQRIAGILEAVEKRHPEDMRERLWNTANEIKMAELSKIYEYATLDRPVVDPLLLEARVVLRAVMAMAMMEDEGRIPMLDARAFLAKTERKPNAV